VGSADREEHRRRWSELHGGVGTRGLVGAWLAAVHLVATPLVRRRVPPDLLTAAGVLSALAAVAVADHPAWAAGLVLCTAVLDGLDGTVAVLSDRVTRRGALLDSVADRLTDVLFLVLLWRVGADAAWCVTAGAAIALLEGLHLGRPVVVTVGERPTRIIVVVMFLLGGSVLSDAAWFRVGAWTLAAVAIVGVLQLVVSLGRGRLARP
jgi:phosphatidylglycerophosphate synthase